MFSTGLSIGIFYLWAFSSHLFWGFLLCLLFFCDYMPHSGCSTLCGMKLKCKKYKIQICSRRFCRSKIPSLSFYPIFNTIRSTKWSRGFSRHLSQIWACLTTPIFSWLLICIWITSHLNGPPLFLIKYARKWIKKIEYG